MDLTDFKQLKYLTVYNNKITNLNLAKCSNLQKISATYTKITKFDSSASKNTTNITTKGNLLTSAKFKHGTKLITISRNNVGGTFAFDYNKSKAKKLTIYASKAKPGYKYLGIYNGSGKKLSSQLTYSCNPTAAKYIVKYKKK
jgi:Leucine-rich repeat (LRR) protein